jgi:hypothetical protein
VKNQNQGGIRMAQKVIDVVGTSKRALHKLGKTSSQNLIAIADGVA